MASGGNRISGNYMYDNGRGISVDGEDNLVEFNTTIANDIGIRLGGSGHLAFRNAVIGNRARGFSIEPEALTGASHDVLASGEHGKSRDHCEGRPWRVVIPSSDRRDTAVPAIDAHQ